MVSDREMCVRVLCPKKSLLCADKGLGLRWLIGSHLFLPPFTVVSSFTCLHALSDDPYSPDFSKEAGDIRTLLIRGFNIVGALFVGDNNWEGNGKKAVDASCRLRSLFNEEGSFKMIGAAADLINGDIKFFVSGVAEHSSMEACPVVYEDNPERYMWDNGCLLRCELALKLSVYVPVNKTSDVEEMFSSVVDTAAAKFRDPHAAYFLEGSNLAPEEVSPSIVLHREDLDFDTDVLSQIVLKNSARKSSEKVLACSYFCSENRCGSFPTAGESADIIRVAVLSNQSRDIAKSGAPIADYFPASEPARLIVVNFKLDVLCFASKDFPVSAAVSKLLVPGLIDQLIAMKKKFRPKLLIQHPQLCPYHFLPPGVLHPVTAIYDLRYGETELEQGDTRKSLHSRLGLPLDRPLLRTANALTFNVKGSKESNSSIRKGYPFLRDVHTELLSSGVSGGVVSFVDGSYEYYHYLLHGIDDNGWGCAYRSLQTIISWFRLQHYTSIDVPSHRDIQQALVEIGDKEHTFVGSREWIGAIELSFVLDKLLGVSCKIMNVRSGLELPEKCRELALHFETQGTPIMIGGGVLAYTLLGVDYNKTTGDCAFLILDPHYTGNDDLKKIINGGWCGWKKAIDSKGRSFFLKDKFYNLLLPQRPNMV